MSSYIIIPRHDPLLSLVAAAGVGFDPGQRRAQYERVVAARRGDVAASDVSRAAAVATRDVGGTVLASPAAETPVTGVIIVEISDERLGRLREALPDAEILPDLPLNLIPPVARRPLQPEVAAAPDLWHLEAIRLAEARGAGFAERGEGVVVAVLDTGISDVAELGGRIEASWEFDAGQRLVQVNANRDTDGHGTHVAGLVCGRTVGVAPGARVQNVLMIPEARGSVANFIFAIEHVATQPQVTIMNMSAGIPGYEGAMRPAIDSLRRVGVLPVVAIGNEGRNTGRSPGNYAAVLTVGASTRRGRVASFSGGGRMQPDGIIYSVPDCVAPGEDVTSCVVTGGFQAWSGTSMATPVVAGLAALIVGHYDRISLLALEDEILSACRPLGFPAERQGVGLAQLPSRLWQGVA